MGVRDFDCNWQVLEDCAREKNRCWEKNKKKQVLGKTTAKEIISTQRHRIHIEVLEPN